MGLCWSSNAQINVKENYPYKYAAAGSTQLWKNLTSANVILQIIYSEPEVVDVSTYTYTLQSRTGPVQGQYRVFPV
jgi:hypothetical protein